MQKKKATRAYKVGYTDGAIRIENKNPYTSGSTRHADYERGYKEGVKS